jgi:hypothetical protein
MALQLLIMYCSGFACGVILIVSNLPWLIERSTRAVETRCCICDSRRATRVLSLWDINTPISTIKREFYCIWCWRERFNHDD